MFTQRFLIICMAVLMLGACGYWTNKEGKINYQPAPPGYANAQSKISLLNPTLRYMIHCVDSPYGSAEDCARYYEVNKNYVRYRDVPYKTANYDFLARETYPTRRWREHERTPRW